MSRAGTDATLLAGMVGWGPSAALAVPLQVPAFRKPMTLLLHVLSGHYLWKKMHKNVSLLSGPHLYFIKI